MKFPGICVGLFLCAFLGFAIGAGEGQAHKHGEREIDVATFAAVPTVSLEVSRDAVAGWNLHVETSDFRFAPESVNEAPRPGEGHAHLYVDEKKVARLYGPWFHLGGLEPGPHQIKVQLNANDHSTLVFEGKPISSSVEVEQADSK